MIESSDTNGPVAEDVLSPARADRRPASQHASDDGYGPLSFREVSDPGEVVALLRLRHHVYFEERRYGPRKPLALDLTAHDVCSRLFGVFRGAALVGGIRLVFRTEQPLAAVFRGLHAAAGEDRCGVGGRLPSEEAFDVVALLGERHELVDAEVGRLVLARSVAGRGALTAIMVATLAALQLARCRFYLYSCAAELAQRYARVAHPRWRFEQPLAAGIQSDDFAFPKRTVAAVAALEDSPRLGAAMAYARALRRGGLIPLELESAPARDGVGGR